MRIQPANRRLGILLSGRGSNFEAIAGRIASGKLNAEIAVVISNVESAPGLERARVCGLPAVHIPSQRRPREEFDREAVELLRNQNVSLVILAGFMRILGRVFLDTFPYNILNIHPSLLPAFPGTEAQRQALKYGAKFSGCTVHFVDDALDQGPIILQSAVPILNEDTVETLSARILKEEHRIYSEAIELVLSGRCEVQGRRVLIGP
ncbi:MAG: phosphoribosylglycinamide formyltransferase [Acidobacteria bacterium]|nr:MAG: phosphoribosylglycinamide formyltransferase [Acidobacteriota bacterium]